MRHVLIIIRVQPLTGTIGRAPLRATNSLLIIRQIQLLIPHMTENEYALSKMLQKIFGSKIQISWFLVWLQ